MATSLSTTDIRQSFALCRDGPSRVLRHEKRACNYPGTVTLAVLLTWLRTGSENQVPPAPSVDREPLAWWSETARPLRVCAVMRAQGIRTA